MTANHHCQPIVAAMYDDSCVARSEPRGHDDLGTASTNSVELVGLARRATCGDRAITGPHQGCAQRLLVGRFDGRHAIGVGMQALDDARREECSDLLTRDALANGFCAANTPSDGPLSRESLPTNSVVTECPLSEATDQ